MTSEATVLVGYAVGSGEPVSIPVRHMAVTGQTQESGKTTTLEALAQRSGASSVLAFVTKRGERSFEGAPRIQPYFRDRADWQFVTSILDATLQEKNKFLRPWIMKICRSTSTLAEVQQAVRTSLKTAKGLNEGVYTQLDAYLDLIVPEIHRAKLATTLDLVPRGGLRVMDVSAFATPMQMLFVQSAIDWVNEHAEHTIVVVPEAWEFIPEGKGSPVKQSAITLVRKGAGIGNRIWVDSQDMAGVDKTILRGCAVWLVGVQREANEIKRNLSNIPLSIKRPTAAQVAELTIGQFYVCWASHAIKTYVRPMWMSEGQAQLIASGTSSVHDVVRIEPPIPAVPSPPPVIPPEASVTEAEARALRDENAALRRQLETLTRHLHQPEPATGDARPTSVTAPAARIEDVETLYRQFKERLIVEAPAILRLAVSRPELEVTVTRKVITADEHTLKGRIAKLLKEGFFADARGCGAVRSALKRTGPDANTANIGRALDDFTRDGFVTDEGAGYKAVAGMIVNILEG